MSDMMLKIPNVSVAVLRAGKSVIPEIGKPFSFTADEIEQINAGGDETPLLDVNVAEAEAVIAAARAAAAGGAGADNGKPTPRASKTAAHGGKKGEDDDDDEL
jgi:hypothetical protein